MKKRILKAAMSLFAKDGYKGVSMRRIARKIEYSPGTLYRYFRNKDDMMRQLCYQGFDQLLSRQIALETIADPLERLTAGSRYYVAFALENPDLYELMFATSEIIKQPEGTDETVALRSFKKLTETVQACMEAGFFSGDDGQTIAVAIWAALHGLSSLLIKNQLRFLPVDRLEQLVETALAFELRPGKAPRQTGKEDG